MISDLRNCDTLRIEQTGSLSSDSIKNATASNIKYGGNHHRAVISFHLDPLILFFCFSLSPFSSSKCTRAYEYGLNFKIHCVHSSIVQRPYGKRIEYLCNHGQDCTCDRRNRLSWTSSVASFQTGRISSRWHRLHTSQPSCYFENRLVQSG